MITLYDHRNHVKIPAQVERMDQPDVHHVIDYIVKLIHLSDVIYHTGHEENPPDTNEQEKRNIK